MQFENSRSPASRGPSRQHRDLHSVGEARAHQPALDVRGSWLEILSLGHGQAALIVLEQRWKIGASCDHGAVRSRSGNEFAHRSIGRPEIELCNPDYIFRGYVLDLVVVQEHQPPVALGDGCGQAETELLGIRQPLFDSTQKPGLHPFHIVFGWRILDHAFDYLKCSVTDIGERLRLAQAGRDEDETWIMQLPEGHVGRSRFLGVDQRLGQSAAPTARSAASKPTAATSHDASQHLQRPGIGMTCCRGMIGHHQFLSVADAAQLHKALAILNRLHGVGLIENALRAWNFSASLGNKSQRFRWVELPGDDQYGIIRLVKLMIKSRIMPYWSSPGST